MLSARYRELEDPPDLEDLARWQEVRALGRRRYLLRGAFVGALLMVGISLLAKWTVWVWFAKSVEWWGAAVAGLAGLVEGAIHCRHRWELNETRAENAGWVDHAG